MSTPQPVISSVSIRGFMCLRSVDVELAPLTVLIGKNDTGKSSFLEALEVLTYRADGELRRDDGLYGVDWAQAVVTQDPTTTAPPAVASIAAETEFGPIEVALQKPGPVRRPAWAGALGAVVPPYQLSATRLREPALIGTIHGPLPYDGRGLPAALDRLLKPHWRIDQLERQLTERIPTVKSLNLEPVPGEPGLKKVTFELVDGAMFDADQMSDGAMLVLGYLAIVNDIDPPRLVMIEEPETGLHPKQLKGVIELLYDLSRRSDVQIVLTTHSPYLLDYVDADAVRVFVRDAGGSTEVHNFVDLPKIKELLADGFSIGEAWLNTDENELVAPPEKHAPAPAN